MPVRVELRPEAIDDLVSYATSGNLPLFLKKLLRLEAVGKDAGLPLGRGLTGWRKIVVGDRNWRIIFATEAAEAVTTIWVIGEHDDEACYKDALRRVDAIHSGQPEAVSLAAAVFKLSAAQRAEKKQKRKCSYENLGNSLI